MKTHLFLLIICCLFSSCSNIHTYFTNQARDYDGVLITNNGYHTWYSKKRQTWLQGQQASFRKSEPLTHSTREWLLGAETTYTLIPNSEGKTVYSLTRPSRSSFKWEQQDMSQASVLLVPTDNDKPVITGNYRLNSSALYAYPLAALTFIALDIPLSTLYVATGGILCPANYFPNSH